MEKKKKRPRKKKGSTSSESSTQSIEISRDSLCILIAHIIKGVRPSVDLPMCAEMLAESLEEGLDLESALVLGEDMLFTSQSTPTVLM